MGVELPDEPDESPDGNADRRDDQGGSGQAIRRNLIWEFSPLLISAERGDLQNDFIEITEDEANQIVARIRAKVTGTSNG